MRAKGVRNLVAVGLMFAFIVGSVIPVLAQGNDQETLWGVLSEGEYGLELKVDDQTYVLEDYLPEDLIGRRVKITGSVEEGQDGTLFLSVDAFDPVE